MKINIITLVFLVALGLTLSSQSASAQNKSAKKKLRQVSNSPSATGKVRARRVNTKPADSSPDQSAVLPESPSEDTTKSTATKTIAEEAGDPTATKAPAVTTGKPGEKSASAESLSPAAATEATKAPPDDPISLREQIDTASNGAERIRLQLKLSQQLLAAGKKPEATKELLAIINADTFYPQGYYNAGNALARLGNSADAINAYRKAIDQRKGNYSRALNNLGVILLREGRWDEAHDALLSALNQESFHYAEASYNLGRLYFARGESEMATREWRRALKIDPEHRGAAQALGVSEAGAVVVKPEVSAKPTTLKNNVNRTSERRSSPSPLRGKDHVLDSVSYDLLQRARNLRERGKLDESVENYRRVISRADGYFAPANLELSYALLMLNKVDEAFASLQQIATRDGAQYPVSYYHLGRLHERKGDLILAEESFAMAAAANKSKDNSFLLDLSRVRERRGNFKGALEAMETYLSTMEKQGLKLEGSDEKLLRLRRKAGAESN